jgi:hypothetical protein
MLTVSFVGPDPERPLSANLFCTAKIYSFDQFVRAQQESLGDGLTRQHGATLR